MFLYNFFPLGFVNVLTLANLIGTSTVLIMNLICTSLADVEYFVGYLFLLLWTAFLCCLLIWELRYLSFLLKYFYTFWVPIYLLSLGSFTKNGLIFRMVLDPLSFIFYLFLFIHLICFLTISYTYLVHCVYSFPLFFYLSINPHSSPQLFFPYSCLFVLFCASVILTRIIWFGHIMVPI